MKKQNNDLVTSKLRNFIKHNIIFIILFIVLLIASFVVWKRSQENVLIAKKTIELKFTPQPSAKSPPTLGQDLNGLSNRITALEQRSQLPQLSTKELITLELLRGVLEDSISINILKTYLSRIPGPWAQAQLGAIAPIQHCLTYTKLDHLLAVPPQPTVPPEQLTFWQRVKAKINALISIRKIDSNGGYKFGQLEDVHKELLNHDVVKAIEAYEKLPETEKQNLSVWLKAAQDRRMLERIRDQILTDLAQGGTP